MIQSFDRLKALHLAGTVSIPSPFPQIGCISLATLRSPGDARRTAQQQRRTAETFLQIEHVQSPRLMISRVVSLADVQAVFLPESPEQPHFDQGVWHLGGVGQRDVVALLRGPGPDKRVLGIVYVKESAQLLMQVEVGMTAAESVEYYPPVMKDRTDSHYDLGSPESQMLFASCDCSEVQPPLKSQLQSLAARSSCDCSH